MQNLRRVTGIFIYREVAQGQYELLLIQTRNFKDEQERRLYTIVGGRIEDETEEACARRETTDEVGLTLENLVKLGVTHALGRDIGYKDPDMRFEFHHYCARGTGTIILGEEVSHADWYSLEQIRTLEPMDPVLRAKCEEVYAKLPEYAHKSER